jgi:hypothetical protein
VRGKVILLIGTVLSSISPISAQTATPAPPVQHRPQTMIKRYQDPGTYSLRTVSSPGMLVQSQLGRVSHFAIGSSGSSAYKLDRLLGSENSDTVFASQWRLPLIEFCRGHLQVSAFQTTLHMDNVMFGPDRGVLRSVGLPRLNRTSQSQSVDLSGFSLGFRFGRDWRTEHLIASRLPHIVHNIAETTNLSGSH